MIEFYCDGNGDLTDIRKYFSYTYDAETNKITLHSSQVTTKQMVTGIQREKILMIQSQSIMQ